MRHNRDTLWPVCEAEDWLSKHLTPIRHHIDKVPPYNYTGIDENINGLFGTLDESSSFYLPESGDTSKDDDTSEIDGPVNNTITSKARTLPENTSKYAILKHKRSLSESKTSDGISLTLTTHPYISRTRFNSGTDSNTSGVSSYESVFGIVMGDLCKTLSPIPSSSNLLEVKKQPNERFRRISLTGASFREPSISPQDAQGYAKLRSIRRHQRPMLSESAADELAEIIDSNIRASNKLTIGQQQRKLKVRSLDRHSNLVPIDLDGLHSISQSNDTSSAYASSTPYTRGPCYSGICLPKNILDLFPVKTSTGTYVSRCVQDMDLTDLSSTMKQQFMTDFISECDESSVSSLSDISSTTSKRSKFVRNKHNRNFCLLCCRSALSTSVPSTKDYRLNNISRGGSVIGTTLGADMSEVDGVCNLTTTTITPHRRRDVKSNTTMIPATSDISFNSPESFLSDDSSNEKIQSTILRHVQRMANPVWSKQSKMALFKMKQKHFPSFQDICLYSEVCKALSRNTYRLSARRFLQELFLDVDYSTFYNDALDIINNKEDLTDLSVICNNQDAIDGYLNVTSTTTAPTNSAVEKIRTINCLASTSAVPVVTYSIKTHLLKSPPLASVHETSRENLSESLGTNPKSTNNSITISNGFSANIIDTKATVEFPPSITIISSATPAAIESNTITNHIDHSAVNKMKNTSSNDRRIGYSRPRFNTLELDLSCTKNKFPITDRRKTFDVSASISNSALYSQRITKSLSASITTPTTTSLYCEKRLQTSKSEAILSNNVNDNSYTNHCNNNNNCKSIMQIAKTMPVDSHPNKTFDK